MACEQYNLLKEGDVRNRVETGLVNLTPSQMDALYDGSYSTAAITLSGSVLNSVKLEIEFGEAFDICYIDYYTSDTTPSHFSLSHGTISGNDVLDSFSLVSPGKYRANLNTFARLIHLNHTVSGIVVDINQVDIIGTRNEQIGFGISPTNQDFYKFIDNSPIGVRSSSPTVIPIFNDKIIDETVRVAIAPTFTEADDYLFLSTLPSGTFYGINEFGYRLPGYIPPTLANDNMLSTTLSNQWGKILSGGQHKILPNEEGLIFDLAYSSRYLSFEESLKTIAIFSKDSFNAVSFTTEVEIRFLETSGPSTGLKDRTIFFAFSNGFPNIDPSHLPRTGSVTRRSDTVGGIILRWGDPNGLFDRDNLYYALSVLDGKEHDSPYLDSSDSDWLNNQSPFISIDSTDNEFLYFGPLMSDLDFILGAGTVLPDFSTSAVWHNWKLVYDARRKELSAYVDKILIGRHIFRGEPPQEDCRLVLGGYGSLGLKFQTRNFKFTPGLIYDQKNIALTVNGGVATATISGSEAYKAIDGDVATVYVGPNPSALTQIRVDFAEPYNVVNYRLTQRDTDSPVNVYGHSHFVDTARAAIVDFGGSKTYVHTYPAGSTLEASDVIRGPTYSGTATTISGIDYLSFRFTSYDASTQPFHGLMIAELSIAAEFETVDLTYNPVSSGEKVIPWSRGYWNNIRMTSGKDILIMRDLVSPDAGYCSYPEYTASGIDFAFSSSVNQMIGSVDNDYPHSESLFWAPDSQSSKGWFTGNVPAPYWAWRQFDEHRHVKAIYWDANVQGSPQYIADSFKFQYLKLEGNPNNESDWIDIPAITLTHPITATTPDISYKNYRDFLIANVNGAFYTNYKDRPSNTLFSIGKGDSSTPTGLVVPNSYGIEFNATSSFSSGYVEFDQSYFTKAIRFYITVPRIVVSGGTSVSTSFGLNEFKIFSSTGAGSLTTPVFDTGGTQNTERIRTSFDVQAGSDYALYYRSKTTPPSKQFDPTFETWEDLGEGGNESISNINTAGDKSTRVVIRDNKAIYLLGAGPGSINSAVIYDYDLDSWTVLDDYPKTSNNPNTLLEINTVVNSSIKPGVLPDDLVKDNSVFIGDILYVACFSSSNGIRSPRIMKFDFSNNLGWTLMQDYRHPESERATMVGHNNRLYFFSRTGNIFYYSIAENIWVQVDNTMPLHGSTTFREAVGACVWNSKIYLFGGSISGARRPKNVDVFDPITETIISDVPAPFGMGDCQALPVPEEGVIYLLPSTNNSPYNSKFAPVMKFFPDEGRWEVISGMSLSRGTVSRDEYYNEAMYYYYKDGYIYKHSAVNFARALVRAPAWTSGQLPGLNNIDGWRTTPWKRFWGGEGELMPQEQYIQLKAEFYSLDRKTTPILKDISVISPHDLVVPASGTGNVYLKVGVSDEAVFQTWYTGEAYYLPDSFGETGTDKVNDFSILYSEAPEGLSWTYPTTVSGVVLSTNNTIIDSALSPWVVKNNVSSYQMWFSTQRTGATSIKRSISYAIFSNPKIYLSGTQKVIDPTVNANCINGAYQPSVLKESSSSYKMLFTGINSSNKRNILLALSSDGITWTSVQSAILFGQDAVNGLDAGEVYRPCLIKIGSLYHVWYTGVDALGIERILHRTSLDGITWGAIDLALNIGAHGRLDSLGVSRPMVILDGPTYYLYYFGYDGASHQLLRASSPDGDIWADFVPVLPPYGIHADLDTDGLFDFFILVDRVQAIPNRIIETGKLKLYD